MDVQLLRDRGAYPSGEVLAGALAGVYPLYESFMAAVDGAGLVPEWRYYDDGGAWLCKVTNGKKTVFWLSVWDGYFQVSFFFLERHLDGLAALGLDGNGHTHEKECGRMLPLIFRVTVAAQVTDIMKVVEFKKKAK